MSKSLTIPSTHPSQSPSPLRAGDAPQDSRPVLLCDVSGSMGQDCGDGQRTRLDALKKCLEDFRGYRQFSFSYTCVEQRPYRAFGGTNMALAFKTMKQKGISRIILITDGEPDNVVMALDAATGLQIDSIYIGPLPMPKFLESLARLVGGSFQHVDLAKPKALESQVQTLLLEGPKSN